MKPRDPLPPLAAPDATELGSLRLAPRVRALGIAAIVLAAIAFLNFGSLPTTVSTRQLIVAFLAVGFAVEALRWLRRGVRRQARSEFTRKVAEYGGGLYGTIAVATLAYLTAMDFYDEIVAAGSLSGWISSLSLGWLIRQGIEAVRFGITSALWPWYWLSGNASWMVAGAVWAVDGVGRSAWRWLATRQSAAAEAKRVAG